MRCLLILLPALTLALPEFFAQSRAAQPIESRTAPSFAPPSFRNDVMAVLSKSGCNAGTCHGNKNGKGGFKLSLRGENPDADFLSLTHDAFSRRFNPFDPDQSLILLKPTTQIAHQGGRRFDQQSAEYQILSNWIRHGAPNDLNSAPRLERLELNLSDKVLIAPEDKIQLRVRAKFSDGAARDITSLAVYDSATPVAKISRDGLVERERFGETTLLVRYLQCQEPVRLAFIPARPNFKWQEPPSFNYIDDQIFAKLRTLRMNPSRLCSDATFLRRAFLDLLGILPAAQEAQAFVSDPTESKRMRLIESLLDRSEFADFWALKWADLLRVEAHSLDTKGVQSFHRWIRQSIAENKPLDQFVRELITARGSTYANPASNYYRPNRDPLSRAKAAAQIFLGARLQCAECHNHPSDRWTQDDYYDWAGLFARIDYKVIENNRDISSDKHEWKGEQIVYLARHGSVVNPRTGKPAQPRFLGMATRSTGSSTTGDDLEALADWMTGTNNLWFARVQANRIWSHLMGRGLVDPPDDFRATNPASHPALLDALAADFINHHFDVRCLIRLIMNSRAYQLSSDPNETNQDDETNYSHALVRRLAAEQLLDCESEVTGTPLRFGGYPAGLRAAQLPGVRPESKNKRRANQLDLFLETFGKPPRLLASDTERSCDCNMGQAFQMISGPTVNELLAEKQNRITALISSGKPNREIVTELYWTALTRPPSAEELAKFVPELDAAPDRRAELEDIAWGLLNSKDFLFRK